MTLTFIKIFAVALLIFFVIDILWLSLFSRKLYNNYLSAFLGDVKWVPAILFYIIFILGLAFFVINPALLNESFSQALLTGMFFGFIAYATYDLTNLATIQNWPIQITIIDLIWGTFLGGAVSSLTYLIIR